MLKIIKDNGFSIAFNNGLTVYVQTGDISYTDKIEVNIIDEAGNFATDKFMLFEGLLPVDDVFEIIDRVRKIEI